MKIINSLFLDCSILNRIYRNTARVFTLNSIQLFRDDFLYYWDLSKVFVRLNLKSYALKSYRRTLRLLRISKTKHKKKIRKDIDSEIRLVKKSKEQLPDFDPIISLDRYHSSN